MGKIFFVLGKSSSGKDTIFGRLKEDSSLRLKTVVGYTTRPIRSGEKNGVEYFFVSPQELQKLKESGKVIECRDYNTVHGIWSYFTVDDGQIDLADGNYLYIGTLESFVKMAAYYGKSSVVPVYIEVEAGERLLRAVKREQKQQELCRRFLADEKDFDEKNIIAAGIEQRFENRDLERCICEIKAMISEQIGESCV